MFKHALHFLAAGTAAITLAACGGDDNPPPERASLRVVHAAPNVPAVDVFVKRPGEANAAGNRVLQSVMFPAASNYLPLEPGTYDASVALAGTLAGVLNLNGAALAPGSSTTVLAIGLLNGTGAQALRLNAYADDRAPAVGQAKVRVIHASPDAPAVDVVVLNGATIAARPVQNLAFPNATTASLVLAPGTYSLGVTATGQSSVVASGNFTLMPGDVATIVAAGCLSTTGACAGGQPFQFRTLDDR